MDRAQVILLMVLAVTWLLWRRARTAARRAELEQALAEPRWRYELAAFETEGGRGYVLTGAEAEPLDNEALDWDADGVAILPLTRSPATLDVSLPPGTPVVLEPGGGSWTGVQRDAGVPAVRVSVAAGNAPVGEIQGAAAAPLAEWIGRAEVGDAIVMFESRAGASASTWLLVVHRDASVEG